MSQPARTRRRIASTLAGLLAGLLALVIAAGTLLWAQAEKVVLGAEGYLFGVPLVLMDLTRSESTTRHMPENQLRRARYTPTADFREVVRPTVDLLYTSAFIDLAQGPWVLRLPPNPDRFEVFSLLDAWTDVYAAPGTRTHGGAGGSYLLAGPDWRGEVPAGMRLLRGSTRMAWLIGRTQVAGTQDLPRVHQLQDGVSLMRIGQHTPDAEAPATSPAYSPANPTATPPAKPSASATSPAAPAASPLAVLRAMDTQAYFTRLALLMKDNRPRPTDRPMVMKLERLGLSPGQPPAWGWLDHASVALGRWIADHRLARELAEPRQTVAGWQTPPDLLGRFGTAYSIRAAVAMVGLGANLPEDAMYPTAQVDGTGQPLDGSHRYRIRFAPGQLPPVSAFWSVTAYGSDDFLQEVASKRHAVGSRDALVVNADGSLDLLVQAEPPPAAWRANWLAVRAGERFTLTARLYGPQEPALQRRWHMPPVERLPRETAP